MTFNEEIAALRERIAKAESDRDTWRMSGMQDHYLEAYSRVEALELQLERLRQEGARASARTAERAGAVLPDEPLAAEAAPDAPGERARLMAQLSIAHDGRHYRYDRYRYDHLADALDYARLQRSELPDEAERAPVPLAQPVEAPDEAQRQLMASLAITFHDGVYLLGPYRYDRLADAVSYARLQRTFRK